ncbi:MAG: hypothetical protein ABGZ53_34245 [Fuerstiella sp.]
MIDLQNDPHEMQSVYGRPEVADTGGAARQPIRADARKLRAPFFA